MPRQSDILRAMKAANRLGMTVRILADGSIVIVPIPPVLQIRPYSRAIRRVWAV